MNRLNFNQSVGFPLETEILDSMQTAYSLLNALGAISGNFSIISGCELTGSTVANGVVYINGEVLEFRGGNVQTNVKIFEEIESLEFEDADTTHEVIFTRYVGFGTATMQWAWATFKRGMPTIDIEAALFLKEEKTTVAAMLARVVLLEARPVTTVPAGLIAIWGGAFNLIPPGWIEYLPLKGRTAVGFDGSVAEFDVLGDFGGAVNKTLVITEIPAHGHDWLFGLEGDDGSSGGSYNEFTVKPGVIPATSAGTPIGKTGGGQAFSLMNPFRVVHYIQKT
jgi:hypothetical protein